VSQERAKERTVARNRSIRRVAYPAPMVLIEPMNIQEPVHIDQTARSADRALATRFPIVGVGASAGGLAAFEAFFSGMPVDSDSGMAFVLVQHLAPDHKSILVDLVKRYTRMEVFEVEDGMRVLPNCTYIIPPNRDMALLNGTLQLLEAVATRGQRLSVDFFSSLWLRINTSAQSASSCRAREVMARKECEPSRPREARSDRYRADSPCRIAALQATRKVKAQGARKDCTARKSCGGLRGETHSEIGRLALLHYCGPTESSAMLQHVTRVYCCE
jgi:hypothetical protein